MFSSTERGPICPELGSDAVPPADVADLYRRIGELRQGLAAPRRDALPDPEAADEALRELIARAQALAAGPGSTTAAAG